MVVVAWLEAMLTTQTYGSLFFCEKRDPLRLLSNLPCSTWRWSEIGKGRGEIARMAKKKNHVIHDWCFHSWRQVLSQQERLKCYLSMRPQKRESWHVTGESHVAWLTCASAKSSFIIDSCRKNLAVFCQGHRMHASCRNLDHLHHRITLGLLQVIISQSISTEDLPNGVHLIGTSYRQRQKHLKLRQQYVRMTVVFKILGMR